LSGGRHGPLDVHLSQGNLIQAETWARHLSDIFGRDRFAIELQIVEPDDRAKVKAFAVARRATRSTHGCHSRYPLSIFIRCAALSRVSRDAKEYALRRFAGDPRFIFSLRNNDAPHICRFPAALDATGWIAGQCQFEFPLGQRRFPIIELSAGRTAGEEMSALVIAGAQQRYGELTDTIQARINKEIHIINTLDYAPYFLIVAGIVRFAREQGVPISPRGSASSSVVAYCLGIHDIDPLAHNLYFERFLSLERHDPPDIDLDLCSHRRDEVIRYVYQKYGAEHVAMVCTYATLRARYALREVGKVYGLPEERIRAFLEAVARVLAPRRAQTTSRCTNRIDQANARPA